MIVTQSPALNTFVSQHNNTTSIIRPSTNDETESNQPNNIHSENNNVKYISNTSKLSNYIIQGMSGKTEIFWEFNY